MSDSAVTTKAAVEELLRAYAAAAHAKDVAAFCAIYADDVRVFDAWDVWEYDGLPAWRKIVTDWFGSLGEEKVGVEFDDVRVVAGPSGGEDFATASMFVTYRGLSAAGEPLRALQGRMTWAVARMENGWKVVQEHSSAPASFETGKVILQR